MSAAHAGTGTAAYAKGISSLAIGVTGTMAITSCVGSLISPYIYSAGAIAMIAGDLILAKAYTDYQKKKKSELVLNEAEMKDGNGDFQKEVIEQRLSMEEEELKNIKKREVLHYALGTVMMTAMGVAIYELIANKAAQAVSAKAVKPFIGYCTLSKDFAMAAPISDTITFTWGQAVNMVVGMASGAGGGTSAFGSWFSYVQMALPLMSQTIAEMMDSMIASDITRSIFFGANAAILLWVAADLSAKKKVAKENIDKLKVLLSKVKNTKTDTGLDTDLPGADEYNDPNAGPKTNIKALPQVAEVKSCLSIGKNSSSFGSSSCKSAVKLSPINFKGGINIPDFQNVASSAVKAANDLAAGNWEGAEVAMGDINSKAAQIREINEQLQKRYNDQMKAEGKPTIDFKGEIAKQVAAIDAEVAKAMGMSGNSLVATAPQSTTSSEESSKEEVATSKIVAPVVPMMDAPAMDLNGIGMGTADVSGEAPSKSLDESLSDYEVAENDIVKDPGVSIFKQVSNRYILNYNRFFNAAKKSLSPAEEGAETKTSPVATP